MANRKRYIDQSIYHRVYIDMSDISREIYQYIRYIGRNIWTDYFFLNKHPSSPKHFPNQWQFFYLRKGLNLFQTRQHEKLITTFFNGYFPSPSVYHKNLRFCWRLLRTIMYSLELEKLIITFFRKKMKKYEVVTIDIYWCTPIYRTPISI